MKKKYIYIFIYAILFIILLILIVKFSPFIKLIFGFIWRLLLPFILAALISYIVYPMMLKLESFGIKKVFAILIIFISFMVISFVTVYKSFPIFVNQLEDFSKQIPYWNETYEDIITTIYERTAFLPEVIHTKLDEFLINIEKSMEKQIGLLLEKVTNIVDYIVLLTIIPVLIFYFLKDYRLLTGWIHRVSPRKYRRKIENVFRAVNKSFGAYIRGQMILSGSIITISYIVYEILDLKYALLLATFIGLMNIIPYFGPIIGTIPAVLIAATVSWRVVIIVLIATLFIQVLESSLLSPFIIGKSIALHPVIIIFLLLIGAELAGIIGMILIIPIVTITRAIIIQLIPLKQQSN